MEGKWYEIKVVTKSCAIEEVSGIFYTFDIKGVAIEDPDDIISRKQDKLSWDFADMNIFEYGADAAVVKAYFSSEESAKEAVSYIEEKLAELRENGTDIGQGKIIAGEIHEDDWANEWKKYYKTTKIGQRVIIKPLWEEYAPKDDEVVIEMDPGMAFGTGTHETTMMCIQQIEKNVKPEMEVFDIGTGSGILGITAAKLGATKVTGVDLDEVAVAAARENAGLNKAVNMEVLHGDLVNVLKGKADMVVANIIADVIIYLSDIVKPFIKPGGLFIVSGIILDREQDVKDALLSKGFEIVEAQEMGEWAAITSRLIG